MLDLLRSKFPDTKHGTNNICRTRKEKKTFVNGSDKVRVSNFRVYFYERRGHWRLNNVWAVSLIQPVALTGYMNIGCIHTIRSLYTAAVLQLRHSSSRPVVLSNAGRCIRVFRKIGSCAISPCVAINYDVRTGALLLLGSTAGKCCVLS